MTTAPQTETAKPEVPIEDTDEETENKELREERFMATLDVVLSPQQLAKLADRVAQFLEELEDLEQDKKDTASSFKESITAKDKSIKQLVRTIRTRRVQREVECSKVFDDDAERVFTFRLDTGEQIADRPMRPVERPKQSEPEPTDDTDGETEETEEGGNGLDPMAKMVNVLVEHEKPMRLADLIEKTEIPEKEIKPLIKSALAEGHITNPKRGQYAADKPFTPATS